MLRIDAAIPAPVSTPGFTCSAVGISALCSDLLVSRTKPADISIERPGAPGLAPSRVVKIIIDRKKRKKERSTSFD